jgi:serine protease AprX
MVVSKKVFAINIVILLIISGIVFPTEFTSLKYNNVAAQQAPSNLLDGGMLKKQIFSEKLIEELKTSSESQLEVIIQFRDAITNEDIQTLESLDFKILRQYKILPAIYAIGKKDAINALYGCDRIRYIQPNENLTYFMDQSTTTINATKAWERKILDKNGGVIGKIDGSGVTVVVLDTGVDAGHPDLDYGKKVIKNLKSDGIGPWYEMENSDTSSGHGTHVAGTVGGNGGASAGVRKGVAPGANIIGLSVGEAMAIVNALGGLEWVYEHSKPNENIYNIRIVSNSWGGGGAKYDSNDIISQAAEKLLYENNVICVFAAGNSGGSGSDIQTSGYANTPAVISVAAANRDGSGIADFSSKGLIADNSTYPDVAAPGVGIWSTAARRTIISAQNRNDDPYYFAISGTSMATPHVSGAIALLFQAAPSLKVSDRHDDGNSTAWWNNSNTKIHEAEWILKVTADYMRGSNVPMNGTKGMDGLTTDYSQGYGLINVDKAVALALTLNELRKTNPNSSISDALKVYNKTMKSEMVTKYTNAITTGWSGEYTSLTDNGKTVSTLSNQKISVFVPSNISKILIDLAYQTLNKQDMSAVTLGAEFDSNADGTAEWTSGIYPNLEGYKHYEVEVSTGTYSSNKNNSWDFKTIGKFIGDLSKLRNGGYYDLRTQYTFKLTLVYSDMSRGNFVNVSDWHTKFARFEFGFPNIAAISNTSGLSNISISMPQYYYDMGEAVIPTVVVEVKKEQLIQFTDILLPLIILIVALTALLYYKHRRKKKGGKQ